MSIRCYDKNCYFKDSLFLRNHSFKTMLQIILYTSFFPKHFYSYNFMLYLEKKVIVDVLAILFSHTFYVTLGVKIGYGE